MKFSSTNLKWFKPFIILLIIVHLYSCLSWHVLKEPYIEQINDQKPKLVKSELYNGEGVRIYNSSIKEDRMSGIILEKKDKETFLPALCQDGTSSVSQCDFNLIKEKKINGDNTIVFIFFVGTLVGVGILVPAISRTNFD